MTVYAESSLVIDLHGIKCFREALMETESIAHVRTLLASVPSRPDPFNKHNQNRPIPPLGLPWLSPPVQLSQVGDLITLAAPFAPSPKHRTLHSH